METLVLCETQYKLNVLINALSLGQGDYQSGLLHFAPQNMWITTKMHEWQDQARRACRDNPQIGRIVLTRKYMYELPANYFCITNASDFGDAVGLDLNQSVRNKLETRFFDVEYVPLVRFTESAPRVREVVPPPPAPTSCKGLKRLREPEDGEDCVVCMSFKATILMTPCSHQNVCDTCARQILTEDAPKCPMCREPVQEAFRPIKN